MSEEDSDNGNPWIFNKVRKLSEHMLDSHERANILIMLLIALVLLPILGIGMALMRATAPIHQFGAGIEEVLE